MDDALKRRRVQWRRRCIVRGDKERERRGGRFLCLELLFASRISLLIMFLDVKTEKGWSRAILVDKDPFSPELEGPIASMSSAIESFTNSGFCPLKLIFEDDDVSEWGKQQVYVSFSGKIIEEGDFNAQERDGPEAGLTWRKNEKCRRIVRAWPHRDEEGQLHDPSLKLFGYRKPGDGWEVAVRGQDQVEEKVLLTAETANDLRFEIVEHDRAVYVEDILRRIDFFWERHNIANHPSSLRSTLIEAADTFRKAAETGKEVRHIVDIE